MKIYSNLKVFKYPEKLASLPTKDLVLAPITMRIKPTNICNHACSYCSYKNDSRPDLQINFKTQIPKDKMIEIANDIVDIGVKGIIFSGGGEPLIYPYLLDILKILHEGNIKFATLTNGSLLTGEISKMFAKYGTWIRISMDGWDDESYAHYRKIKGEFTKIMRNIAEFKSYKGKCILSIVLIIDQFNFSKVYEMIVNLKHVGADSVKISPVIISADMEKNREYHKTIKTIVQNQVINAIDKLTDNSFEIWSSYPDLDRKFTKDYDWCPYSQLFPIIGADLGVYACHDKAYTLKGKIDSLKNQSFKEMWFKSKPKLFEINPSKDCNHHCEPNIKNQLILEYLNINQCHLGFL